MQPSHLQTADMVKESLKAHFPSEQNTPELLFLSYNSHRSLIHALELGNVRK